LPFCSSVQGAADRLAEVDLALDLVGPQRRVAVLEVGHVAVGARVEGVDDHLGLHRAGDLHAAAVQRGRNRRDLPVAVADVLRLGKEVGALAGVEPPGTRHARGQQLLAARLEGAVQRGHQFQRRQGEHGLEPGKKRGVDLHALRQRKRGHGRTPEMRLNRKAGAGVRGTQRAGLLYSTIGQRLMSGFSVDP